MHGLSRLNLGLFFCEGIYYFAKLINDIYETEESEKDDKNHEMPAHEKVITRSYMEIIKM